MLRLLTISVASLLTTCMVGMHAESEDEYDPFPMVHTKEAFHFHFKECLNAYSDEMIYPDDLKTDEDRTIFFSGCVYALDQIRRL